MHVKNLKPFEGSNSRNFSSNFQKQGGDDANNFDHSRDEDEDEKFERSDRKDKRDKRRPKNSTRRMMKTKPTKVPQTQNRKMKNVE
jgi:hypothetical protein